jgi:predicted 3-demethylubiquinone-9 3-methyltransferase (glyoxalase superfamily)
MPVAAAPWTAQQSGGYDMPIQQKIAPFLWFDANAEQAVNHYLSIFKDSKILATTHYGDGGPGPKGSVMTIDFELEGQRFTALNGGPHFKFTEAVSFVVACETQQEIDAMWTKLTAGGQEVECGWLKDKFGLFWQVVPTELPELLSDRDPEKANRVMQAVLKMKKLDLAKLREAAQATAAVQR